MADEFAPTVEIKGRKHRFFASGGTLFEINDQAAPYMAMLAKNFPVEVNKALGSLGYHLRLKMREVMSSGGIGGSWPKHAGIYELQDTPVTEKARRRRERRKQRGEPEKRVRQYPGLYGDLYMAVGYKRDKANMRVKIGFLSKQSFALAAKLQEGFETPVTAKMRELYHVHGLKLSGTSIKTPARPLVHPVYMATKGQYESFIEAKILAYMERSRTFVRAA